MSAPRESAPLARPEEQRAVEEMRARAAAMWGEARASAIEAALQRTALAVRAMSQLDFSPHEAPAFYLAEFGARGDSDGGADERRDG